MSVSGEQRRESTVGGPPGSLKAWLFALRLPANEHRVMELHCEKADPEDGCHWRGEAWIAHWAGMTTRNVRRVVRGLEARGLLKVWEAPGRSNVYQVQCPHLPRLDDLSRVEALRGGELGAHREPPDNSGSEEPTPDNLSAPEPRTTCPPTPDNSGEEKGGNPGQIGSDTPDNLSTEVSPENTSTNYEDPQGGKGPPTGGPGADPAGRAPPSRLHVDYGKYIREWNEAALPCMLPLVQHGTGDKLRTHLRARIASKFPWERILAKLPECRGAHGKKFLTLDFVVKNDDNWRRILDGNYDEPFNGGQGGKLRGPPADAYTTGGGVVELGSE